ncbi:MAG: queuosine precursor transporter [Gammaproteobacteria bacterium]|nr:queuosine precursor transporter [Gammaproteobacteria bacterium]
MTTQDTDLPSPVRGRHYRYFDLLMAAFVAVLLCSNLIGPAKVGVLNLPFVGGDINFGAGNLFFPLSYIFGDVLTEVYGYARTRKVIWAGFAAMLFATVMAWVIIHLPVSPSEPFNAVLQPALETVFGSTWRIVCASMVAFWAGDFVNSFVMAKMKLLTRGRWLWTRTIGSTIVGQGMDSLIFYPIAFLGIWSTSTVLAVMLFNWIFKVGIEVLMTPFTYALVGTLKRAEQEDFYDTDTDFTPFSLKD